MKLPHRNITRRALGLLAFIALTACQSPTENKGGSGSPGGGVIGNTPSTPAPAGSVYIQGTLSGNSAGYQVLAMDAKTGAQSPATLDSAGHFYVAFPQSQKAFVVAWKDLNGNGTFDMGNVDAYSVVGQILPGASNFAPLDIGTTNTAEIVVSVGTPATLTLTVNLPAATVSSGHLSTNLAPATAAVAAGVGVVQEFFGATAGRDSVSSDVPAGATSATVTVGARAGVAYKLVSYFESSGPPPSNPVSGTTSYNSSAMVHLDALASGTQTLTLNALKYRTISGTVTNVAVGTRLTMNLHTSYPGGAGSYGGFQTILSTTETSQAFATLVVEGAQYSISGYNDASTTGVAGDRFAWYQGTGLTRPTGFELNGADRTDLSIALVPLTSVTVSGKISTPANVDGKYLQVQYQPSLDTYTWDSLPFIALTGGVAVGNRFEYPFTKEVPASPDVKAYLSYQVGPASNNGRYLDSRDYSSSQSSAAILNADTTLSSVQILN